MVFMVCLTANSSIMLCEKKPINQYNWHDTKKSRNLMKKEKFGGKLSSPASTGEHVKTFW